MKKLTLVLFVALLVVSCSSSTDSDTKVIGTWLLNSDTEAEWVGESATTKSKSKAKADTTITLNSPDGTFLEVASAGDVETTDEIRIEFTYTDSTLNEAIIERDSLWFSRTKIYLEGVEAGARPFRINQRIPTVNENSATIFVEFLYTCDMSINGTDDMQIDLYDLDDELASSKVLHTEGFRDVLQDVFCE